MADKDTGQTPDTNGGQTPPDDGGTPGKDADKGTTDPKDVKVPEGYELVKSEDLQGFKDKLSQRSEENKTLDERIKALEASNDRKEVLTDFFDKNKDKYPDVIPEDLELAETPEQMETIAKHIQSRFAKIQQDALASIEVPGGPMLSDEEYDAEKAKLAKENPPDRFQRELALQARRKPKT